MSEDKKREKWLKLCQDIHGGSGFHLRVPLRKKLKYWEAELDPNTGTCGELHFYYDSDEMTVEHQGQEFIIPYDVIISLAKYLDD